MKRGTAGLGWLCTAPTGGWTITHARTEADARERAARRLGCTPGQVTVADATAEDHRRWADRIETGEALAPLAADALGQGSLIPAA